MAAPRSHRLGLEAFEDRALPSAFVAQDHSPPADSQGGWTPAHVRTYDQSPPAFPRGDTPPSDSGANSTAGVGDRFEFSVQVVAITTPVVHPPVNLSGFAVTSVTVAATPSPPSFFQLERPDGSQESQPAANPAVSNRTLPNGPNDPVNADRPGGLPVVLVNVSGLLANEGSEPTETILPAERPTEPPVEPDIGPLPRAVPAPSFADWSSIEIRLPSANPLAGLLDLDGARIEDGVQRVLDLTAGIVADEAGGNWYAWPASAAVLIGGAALAAWSNGPARRENEDRSAALAGEGSDDTRFR